MLQKITHSFAVFRDDVFPFLGGGNKARKMMALHKTIKKGKYNAIVTTGGIQSNHCRAVALYCKKYKLECSLVLHGNKDNFYHQSGNSKIIQATNAKLIFCRPNEISDRMDTVMKTYKKNGYRPMYLYGGGHTLEGGRIYIDAMEEVSKSGFIPDYIFIASGSGTTQAGILAGISKYNLPTQVIGISVGRKKQKAESIVQEFYLDLCEKYGIKKQKQNITVDDSFLCNGYEKYNSCIEKIADDSLVNYGFALDTTYTAKAFYGMKQLVKQKSIHGKILFWYTGGIYNYLAECSI